MSKGDDPRPLSVPKREFDRKYDRIKWPSKAQQPPNPTPNDKHPDNRKPTN